VTLLIGLVCIFLGYNGYIFGRRPVTRRRLGRAAEDIVASRAPSVTLSAIKPGTRLLREWQGVIHKVVVLEEGVRYRGSDVAIALGGGA
jgi:hypothetical protein